MTEWRKGPSGLMDEKEDEREKRYVVSRQDQSKSHGSRQAEAERGV